MTQWLKYMKQDELQLLQFRLGQNPWTPPAEDQVDRMLKEIRAAQTERSKIQNAAAKIKCEYPKDPCVSKKGDFIPCDNCMAKSALEVLGRDHP